MAAILASDSDSGVNGEVTYSLEEDDEDETFLLNPVTGVFNVTRPLDYETQQYYILTAKAQDGGGQASTVRVYFNVLDVNDNTPIFNTTVYSTSVSESLPPGSSIVTIGATDADDGMYMWDLNILDRLIHEMLILKSERKIIYIMNYKINISF